MSRTSSRFCSTSVNFLTRKFYYKFCKLEARAFTRAWKGNEFYNKQFSNILQIVFYFINEYLDVATIIYFDNFVVIPRVSEKTTLLYTPLVLIIK